MGLHGCHDIVAPDIFETNTIWQSGRCVSVTASVLARAWVILEINMAARLPCFRSQRKRGGTLEPGPPIAPDSPDRAELVRPDWLPRSVMGLHGCYVAQTFLETRMARRLLRPCDQRKRVGANSDHL